MTNIDVATGLPETPEGHIWVLSDPNGNRSIYDDYDPDDVSVRVSLVQVDSVKKPSHSYQPYQIIGNGIHSYKGPDKEGVYYDEKYQYKLVPNGFENETRIGIEHLSWFRKHEYTYTVRVPQFKKEYVYHERRIRKATALADSPSPAALQNAAKEALQTYNDQIRRAELLGDYPPKSLNQKLEKSA